MSKRPTKTILRVAAALTALALTTPASAQERRAPEVPEGSQALPVGEHGYILERIGDRLWWAGNGFYQVMFMEGPAGVALIDAPPSMLGLIEPAIAEATGGRTVTHLIYSHGHGDHIGAASAIADARVEIIAHEATARQIAHGGPCTDCIEADNPRPAPTIIFTERYTLDLGDDQILQLSYPGPNHQDGNIFIYAPKQRALMLVDVIYPGWAPFDLLAISTDILGWLSASTRPSRTTS